MVLQQNIVPGLPWTESEEGRGGFLAWELIFSSGTGEKNRNGKGIAVLADEGVASFHG